MKPPNEVWVMLDRDGSPVSTAIKRGAIAHEARVRNELPAWSSDAPHTVHKYVLAGSSEDGEKPRG